MRKHKIWLTAHWTGKVIYWVASIATASLGAALALDTSTISIPWWKATIEFVQLVAPGTLIVLPTLLVVTGALGKRVGNPWVWKTIQSVLDTLQEVAFSANHGDQPIYEHRVTLFRAVWSRRFPFIPWLRKRWLIPYERSGHINKDSKSYFRIGDRVEAAEGVAGMTWMRNTVIVVPDVLPAINNLSGKRNQKIARLTFVSEKHVRDKQPQMRTYCGIPVEATGAKLWGVLVFDSAAKGSITHDRATIEFSRLANILGQLVARA